MLPESFKPMTAEQAREYGKVAAKQQAERMESLKDSLPPRIFNLLENVPITYQVRLAKALNAELSPLKAIQAHCEQCMGWEASKEAIKNCSTRACAVWHHRPYQDKSAKLKTKGGEDEDVFETAEAAN